MELREYSAVVDFDDERNLVVKPTKPNSILDRLVEAGHMVRWSFTSRPTPQEEFIVHVYDSGGEVPTGENLEEINRKAVICVLTLSEQDGKEI